MAPNPTLASKGWVDSYPRKTVIKCSGGVREGQVESSDFHPHWPAMRFPCSDSGDYMGRLSFHPAVNGTPMPSHCNRVRGGLVKRQDFYHHSAVRRPPPPQCQKWHGSLSHGISTWVSTELSEETGGGRIHLVVTSNPLLLSEWNKTNNKKTNKYTKTQLNEKI